ncbi:MAG TPA: Na+/H+ antiporter subunit E [Bacteroidales bacterium]|nr:Na+/H+ antiporter subunit E [Bacteroidales bacterium]HPE55569.1 Na+/H+ antiporter subunit E [Bacteroidales bacterium]HRX95585.1 Na+/H+ antiporter subunit E [Bacteroidales bacterium]
MNLKNVLQIFVLSYLTWLALNWSVHTDVLVTGAIISVLIAVLLCSQCSVLQEVRLTPKSFAYAFGFVGVFWIELFKSNFDVARRVLTPSLPINPGIVEVKTRLKSNIGKMLLANAITLTPGTLTVDILGDRMFIHWIDVSSTDINEATHAIVSKFEKYLEVMYG